MFLDSNCGGFFGVELKKAGFDVLVVTGRAEALSTLIVEDGKVWVEETPDLKGMTTMDAEKALKKRLGEEFRVLTIGPAGEELTPIAGVFTDQRCAGRGGAGAVMGSKNLKAIAVRGSKPISVYDPEGFKKACWRARRRIRMHEVTARSLPTYGTVNILETVNETGALPTRNFKTGVFEEAWKLSGYEWRRSEWVKDKACFGCPIACSKLAPVDGKILDGPDYETVWAFGPQCGVSDRKAILYANWLCDAYGVDTISTGVIVGYVMELYERGVLKADDLDGVEAKWGSGEALTRLVEKICKGEGVGRELRLGVRRLSVKYGLAEAALHVKGLEMPGYEPRAAKGMGLGYATSDRGACHLRAYTADKELLGYGGAVDPISTRGKARLVVDYQNEKALIDSTGICFFATFAFSFRELGDMLSRATGLPIEETEALRLIGERVYNLTRLFDVREGVTRKDDDLPGRLLNEPMPEGPAKGSKVELEEMLDEYYSIRGWSSDGVPERETIERLNLDKLVEDLPTR
ncbi:MAG: hypothetical protein AYL29_007520 [Candidatus Bathyarchaeota archaeon B24]|nr:MAG: hypothetical protein AYL29_007520 [Candidatus Bathyarchaeota archaeon B24]